MSIATSLSQVSRWFRRPRGSMRPQEPADLGTVFGLECWSDEDLHEPPVNGSDPVARNAYGLPVWSSAAARD